MVAKCKKKKTLYEAYLFNWNEGMPSLFLDMGLSRMAYIYRVMQKNASTFETLLFPYLSLNNDENFEFHIEGWF